MEEQELRAARDTGLEEAAMRCSRAADTYAKRAGQSGSIGWQVAVHLEREIRALKPIAAPAPVQQAAPSLPIQAALKRAAGVIELFDDATMTQAGYMLDAGECADIIRTLADSSDYAAPAQPAGLSEQDKLDAARYRAIRDPETNYDYGIGVTDCNHFTIEGKELDNQVDAILAAKEAP
ncbi:hypothetical protein BN2497_10459 [Janthinobacterium sp. CG23_2]|nr:hypothetical protein BN2497_10459 [Janthinobacterium sp. CG23_2]CUU31627.1 hypothetical protein BN3177_10459 [Janthinobacterium sp. CG23_2]